MKTLSRCYPFPADVLDNVKALFGVWATLLLFGFQIAAGQEASWLNDEQARGLRSRDTSVYPQPCYSTIDKNISKVLVVSLRANDIVESNQQFCDFYRVARDALPSRQNDGKGVSHASSSLDCCESIVAVKIEYPRALAEKPPPGASSTKNMISSIARLRTHPTTVANV